MRINTRDKICAIVLKMIDEPGGSEAITMRKVAEAADITPMAIYKHFANRDALLQAATAKEYERIAGYFNAANSQKSNKGLNGMLGYLDYALEHPNLFQYIFSSVRGDAYMFPDPDTGKSPTFGILRSLVQNGMDKGLLRKDDALEISLTIWAFAHGLIVLHLAGRIRLTSKQFRELYTRSLERLLVGLRSSDRASDFQTSKPV